MQIHNMLDGSGGNKENKAGEETECWGQGAMLSRVIEEGLHTGHHLT